MKRSILLAAFLAASLTACFGQVVHRNDIILNKQNKPIAGAKIYVCQQPAVGSPCANQVPLYTDLTGSTPQVQPIISDSNGNFDMYAESQWVTLQVVYGYAVPIIYRDYGLFVVGSSEDFSVDIPTPIASDSGVYSHKINRKVGVTRISCSTDQGSATIDLDVRPESTPNSSGVPVIGASGLVCSPSNAVATLFSSASVPINDTIVPLISNISGSPGILRIHVSVAAQ